MLLASIMIAFIPIEELASSLPIMPLENWSIQVQDRFHAFYSESIGLNISMLPETVGLFLLGLYAGKKDIFRQAKELDSKLKKVANHYVYLNTSDVVLYDSLLCNKTAL